jgi:multidrug efflux pump subunit AcrA (membrane-fusion protein)
MERNRNSNERTKSRRSISGFIKSKWLIILVGLIVATGAGFGITFLDDIKSIAPAENVSTFTARIDDLIVTVTPGGTIRAQKTIEVKNEVDERQMTVLDVVDEGTTITQEDFENGKVLVTLENSQIKDNLVQREMDFASAEATLAQANEAYFIQINQNESDIAAAQLAVKWALMDLQKYTGEELAATIVEDANRGISLTDSYIDSLIEDANSLKDCGAGQALQTLQDNIDVAEDQLMQARNTLNGTIPER